ncbi:MAG: LTA synthase family protein [Lachnospiraceae bacterium]|nr:LTA synthase family protein [Lachnospiraceae bacterium]
MSALIKKYIHMIFFPILFIYMEIAFHIYYYGKIDVNILFAVLSALCFGFLVSALTGFGKAVINKIIAWLLTVGSAVFFGLQMVYGHIFTKFISLSSVVENAGDATEFWEQALHGIIDCIPGLILILIIPIIALAISIKKKFICVPLKETKENLLYQGVGLGIAVIFYLLLLLMLPIGGKENFSAYDLYHKDFMLDLGIERLGVITGTRKDIHAFFFGTMEEIEIIETDNLSSLVLKPTAEITPTTIPATPTPLPTAKPDEGQDEVTKIPEATPEPTSTPLPTPTPIDTSPNVLQIDFAELAENEKNSEIKAIHKYMSEQEPTKKNEYTGMFKGYNFIYLVCEGFSPWAVDEKVTPTLYKLTHEGFVLKNFYTPIWYTSTSDGEYVALQGLVPYSSNSFKRSKKNSLPMCFGWQFLKEGYTSRAYHAHTATYYGRNETHPNLGYEFKAKKAGLEITDVWPESDLEMIQNSLPDYINDEHFHVYYMTVSGHMEYTFAGNTQASRNKEYVQDLPYSSNAKAYIACNKELDKALEYLISELEKAGIADKTVIAFSADHYPYGLEKQYIDELAGHEVEKEFELYKNYGVIWSKSMEEPVIVDKYCSSLDLVPTISNLFGLEYDSRLLMGTDILSDSPALVIFSDKSFITDYCMYNVNNGKITMLQDVELPKEYISSVMAIVKNKFNISKSILVNNYYSYLMDYIPNVVTERPSYPKTE